MGPRRRRLSVLVSTLLLLPSSEAATAAWVRLPAAHQSRGRLSKSPAPQQRPVNDRGRVKFSLSAHGPRLRFASDGPGVLRHLEPAIRRLLEQHRASAEDDGGVLSPLTSSSDIRDTEVAALLEGLVLEDHPVMEREEEAPAALAAPPPTRLRRPLHIPLVEDEHLGFSINVHILPFEGDSLPPSSSSSPSSISSSSTLTLTRLLHGGVTVRRQTSKSSTSSSSSSSYCVCFGGKACPRADCEWRVETDTAAATTRRRIREEVSPLLVLDDDDAFTASSARALSLHAVEPSVLLEVTLRKQANHHRQQDQEDGDSSSSFDDDRFSPQALSNLPFPLGTTTLEEHTAHHAQATATTIAEHANTAPAPAYMQHRIAPPLPFYRRVAVGATSLVRWQPPLDDPTWDGGAHFVWTWEENDASEAAAAGGVGVLPQWGTAPEERLRELGVGGLDAAFRDIFRRVFASRLAPSELVSEMGLKHVRGMLLYGPPGCGKTLLARQIGSLLETREPKVVNGPEVLGSLVGESEANIRELFEDAEREQRELGAQSKLHLIILDEADSILSKRGQSPAQGYRDTVVNQLLSKLDGINALDNVLVIGLTNRKDMIDDAVLRPGRLEVHVEVGMPDASGRRQIVDIHTASMRRSGRMTKEAEERLGELVGRTRGFSGADIEGVVKAASSRALERALLQTGEGVVGWGDLEDAVGEVKPPIDEKQQQQQDTSSSYPPLPPSGILDASQQHRATREALEETLDALSLSLHPTNNDNNNNPLFLLLHGPAGAGKSTLLSHLAQRLLHTSDDASLRPVFLSVPALLLAEKGEAGEAAVVAAAVEKALSPPPPLAAIEDEEEEGAAAAAESVVLFVDGIDAVATPPLLVHTLLRTIDRFASSSSSAAAGDCNRVVAAAVIGVSSSNDDTEEKESSSPVLATLSGKSHARYRLPLLTDAEGEITPVLVSLLRDDVGVLAERIVAAALQAKGERRSRGVSMRGVEGAVRLFRARSLVRAQKSGGGVGEEGKMVGLLQECLDGVWL